MIRKYTINIPVGQKFGKLTVLGYSHEVFKPNRKIPRYVDYWLCRCDCGAEYAREAHSFYNDLYQHMCQACQSKSIGRAHTKHGHTGKYKRPTPEYAAWVAIHGRTNPENVSYRDYHNYVGRGITTCKLYKESFPDFLADVGMKPFPKAEIDRKDNDKGYWCGRCEECVANGWEFNLRWATRREQMDNRRLTRWITHNGETLTMSDWARRANNMNPATFRTRWVAGWSLEKIFNTPVGPPRIARSGQLRETAVHEHAGLIESP